jgi:hypothetical protein
MGNEIFFVQFFVVFLPRLSLRLIGAEWLRLAAGAARALGGDRVRASARRPARSAARAGPVAR